MSEYQAAAELLRALASPLRIAIVLRLQDGPKAVHELVDALGAPQPLVSQHLRVLRGARLVHAQRHGREVAYALVDTHVSKIALAAVQHADET